MKISISNVHLAAIPFAFTTLLLSAVSLAADAAAGDHGNHAMPAAAAAIQGKGVVQSVDAEANTITLAHEPIPAINWPAMTMPFKVLGNAEEKVKAGDAVTFELQGDGADSTITKITKAE